MPDETTPAAGPGSASPQPEAGGGELQFDRADFSDAQTVSCAVCNNAIAGEYFKVDDKTVCPDCRARVSELMNTGSGGRRFIKATIYGTIAAAVGAGIWYAIAAIFGIQVGLISILIGVIVGMAVRAGSEERGGLVYQFLAVFLTYSAIVAAQIPMVVTALQQMSASKRAVATSPAGKKTAAQPKKVVAETTDSPDTDAENESADVKNRPPPGILGVIIALAMVIGIVFALPVLSGGILTILIIGFGLWEAWKLNARIDKRVTGPFHVAGTVAQEARPGSA